MSALPLAFALDAPLFLLLLLLIPAGLVAIHLSRSQRRRRAIRMPATATLKAVAKAQPSHRRWLPVALMAVTVALLSVAMTRPEVTVATPQSRSTVVLVTDASGSMNAEDVSPTRMDAAKSAARRFLGGVPDQTRVGLVGYSRSPSIVQEPTTDRGVVTKAIDALFASGPTYTQDALDVALDAIKAEGDPAKNGGTRPPGAIVLLSDGTPDQSQDPLASAARAKQERVPIYTVALGTAGGTIPGLGGQPQPVPPDPDLMRRIAQASGGESFSVADSGQLDKIYESLGTRVATEAEQREITAGFAGGGLLTLALAIGFALKWRSRVA
jgi:Ca-activated chloride channel family protein